MSSNATELSDRCCGSRHTSKLKNGFSGTDDVLSRREGMGLCLKLLVEVTAIEK